jgi:hypothetical protein
MDTVTIAVYAATSWRSRQWGAPRGPVLLEVCWHTSHDGWGASVWEYVSYINDEYWGQDG